MDKNPINKAQENTNTALNQATAYVIATSEYRAMLHAIAICSANATDTQLPALQGRLKDLEDAIRYELLEVFDIAADEGQVAMMPALSLAEDVTKGMNLSYMAGLEGSGDKGKYPWLYDVAVIRKNNPHTKEQGSLVHVATSNIEAIANTLEDAVAEGDDEVLDNKMLMMRLWTDVLLCHPSAYRTLGVMLTESSNGTMDGGYPEEFVESFLESMDDKTFPAVFGEEAFKDLLEKAKKVN